MTRHISLTPEPMTEAGFAPYGWLIDPPDRPEDRRTLTPVEFGCDGAPTLGVIWQPAAPRRFSRLERHFAVTQTFFQLSGSPAVVCVAAPTAVDDPCAIPDPGAVRAFLIDPTKGYAFARGTWHSLDRYVSEPPGATFAILNVDPNPTQVVDYADGVSTRFADLDVDPEPRRERLPGDFGVTFAIDGPA